METSDMTATAIEGTAFARSPAEQAYFSVRKDFKANANNNLISPAMVAEFTIARVLLNQEDGEEDHELEARALKKLMRAFTPIINAKKLANGRRRWDTLNNHLTLIELGRFSNLCIPEETQAMMKAMAPRLKVEVRATKFASA